MAQKVVVPASGAAARARQEEGNGGRPPIPMSGGKVKVTPSRAAADARDEESEGESEPPKSTKKKGRMPPPGASTPAWKKIAAAMAKK